MAGGPENSTSLSGSSGYLPGPRIPLGTKSSSHTIESHGSCEGIRAALRWLHGAAVDGTGRGPALVGSRRVRNLSIQQLRDLIRNGTPESGMPAFDLPAQELDALAALVHALNAPAAESTVPGDSVAGERFFFGKGQCASCHMVYGKGKPVGPDISNVDAK